jgi:hypothetical protein
MPMLSGWISANPEDAKLLESLGVALGSYDDQFEGFEECLVSEQALVNLKPYWGDKFVWHFIPVAGGAPH